LLRELRCILESREEVTIATTKSEAPRLLKGLTSKLQELPEDRLQEVVDFVDFLQSRPIQQSESGSPEALLQHVGTWSFEPGELDRLLADIEEMRETELGQ
jgi:hypothetical protein